MRGGWGKVWIATCGVVGTKVGWAGIRMPGVTRRFGEARELVTGSGRIP